MSDNSQKTPFGSSLNDHTTGKSESIGHNVGKSLPATAASILNGIITTNWETANSYTMPPATIPHFGPEYIRYPTQAKDKGVVIGNDTDIGNMSGLGPSTPSAYTKPGNINQGVWMPVRNKNDEVTDPNSLVLYGAAPQGGTPQVILMDAKPSVAKTIVTINKNSVTIALQSGKSVNVTGNNVTVNVPNGDVIAGSGSNMVSLKNHLHQNAGGSGDSGPPVPGT